jgi:hypothetical protein
MLRGPQLHDASKHSLPVRLVILVMLVMMLSWPPPAAPGSAPLAYYTSNATRATFIFSDALVSQAAGAQLCATLGGGPATFSSLAEQAEVEAYYVSGGYLLSRHHMWAPPDLGPASLPRLHPFSRRASKLHMPQHVLQASTAGACVPLRLQARAPGAAEPCVPAASHQCSSTRQYHK